jgi:hypothetical protein
MEQSKENKASISFSRGSAWQGSAPAPRSAGCLKMKAADGGVARLLEHRVM